jgi:YHS domain-containing protein
VSDEKLGSMGDPIVDVYNGQQIKFCCKSCVADFKKEPQKFMAKIK